MKKRRKSPYRTAEVRQTTAGIANHRPSSPDSIPSTAAASTSVLLLEHNRQRAKRKEANLSAWFMVACVWNKQRTGGSLQIWHGQRSRVDKDTWQQRRAVVWTMHVRDNVLYEFTTFCNMLYENAHCWQVVVWTMQLPLKVIMYI
jgi:hypothetical protein